MGVFGGINYNPAVGYPGESIITQKSDISLSCL